jgi:hypothetical protein
VQFELTHYKTKQELGPGHFTLKKYLKAKEEELWKTQIFHHAKI